MILLLSEALEVPLRDRNDWLSAAGFAPAFQTRALEDPQMEQVLSAIRMMLHNHEPFPALAVDRAWNIRFTNRAFERLSDAVIGDIWGQVGGEGRNLLRLFFHPAGLRPYVANWRDVAPLVWRRAERETETLGGEDMRSVLTDLRQHQDTALLRSSHTATLLPVMPLRLARDGLTLSLFTVVSTFGTAQDITTDELRIESLFPADEPSERLFRGLAGA